MRGSPASGKSSASVEVPPVNAPGARLLGRGRLLGGITSSGLIADEPLPPPVERESPGGGPAGFAVSLGAP